MTETCVSIESVRRTVLASGWRRIGIDGVAGAGQADLAEQLAEALGFPVLDLDDYLFRNQGGYVAFMDYEALSSALSSIPAYIVSGVCVREVLANAAATLDGHIYIKRMREDLWVDEDACAFPDGVDAAIDNLAAYSAMVSRTFDEHSERSFSEDDEAPPNLSEEIMRYHDCFLPHEAADLVYERSAHPSGRSRGKTEQTE